MTSRKKLKNIAKLMMAESLSNGYVDPKKVKAILKSLKNQKPAGLTNILKTYKRLVERKLSWEEAILETGTKISNISQWEAEFIKKTGIKKLKYRTNRKLVFGAKIIHGDWVWDETLDAKLKRLTNAQ